MTTQTQEQTIERRAEPQGSRLTNGHDKQLARALGWFSIGLGLAEIAAPRGLAKFIGVSDDHYGLFRFLGLREIASGIGILTQPKPAGWMWARVGGDVMDLALLGTALTSDQARTSRVMAATAAVAGVTALDVLCTQQLSRSPSMPKLNVRKDHAIRVEKSVTINRLPEELYRFWHNFENLPHFMSHLESVRMMGDGRSHWIAKAPAGMRVEWDAEIINDEPSKVIAWRSLEGSDVDSAGAVRFEPVPAGRGTEVKVKMHYRPPGGVIAATFAKLFGEEPGQQVQEDLRRFKRIMEAGEIPTTEGQPSGRAIQAGR